MGYLPLRPLLWMLALANLAVSPAWASAQQAPAFVHEVWTVQDGLPVNSINALLQSRDGYLWAATFDGLVRFDGVRFTVYHTGNTEELPSNRIVGLTEGSDGSLWLVTEQRHLSSRQRCRVPAIVITDEAPGSDRGSIGSGTSTAAILVKPFNARRLCAEVHRLLKLG